MIFPTLGGRCGYVNLELAARAWLEENPQYKQRPNPFNDPIYCAFMVQSQHDRLGIDFSYGGWLENRPTLWKDSYLEPTKKFLHLGVDFNAAVGTEIAVDFDAEVVRVDDDHPEVGGWGPRVIFLHKEARMYMIYAHLSIDVTLKAGDKLKAGDIFAWMGDSNHNGGWYPHLHVQAVTEDTYLTIERNGIEKLDGYQWPAFTSRMAVMFPDPMQYVRISK